MSPLQAGEPAGKVLERSIRSESLHNDFGEETTRRIAVYLPPGYDDSTTAYPVIYFLHGFNGDHRIIDALKPRLDAAIGRGKIGALILVVSNQKTTYGGSFYCNSELFGNWEDFTAIDVVQYVDQNFRTLRKAASRGIAGHSMGGYGAIKIAMRYPNRFGSAYALSPGGLAIVEEYGPDSQTYRDFENLRTIEQIRESYFGSVVLAFGRSWSPNTDKPPFYCDVPFSYPDGDLVIDEATLTKWRENMPYYMLDDYHDNLTKLSGLMMDWGRNAEPRFLRQCDLFSRKLEKHGVEHFAETYIGDHGSGIYDEKGRISNRMLPFFGDHLEFE